MSLSIDSPGHPAPSPWVATRDPGAAASAATQAGTSAPYRRRRPERTPLVQVVQDWLTTYLELARAEDWDGDAVPPSSANFAATCSQNGSCGILACGFARAYCDACGHDLLVVFSCKGRGVCPSCMARRMAETAAHLAADYDHDQSVSW